MKLEINSKVEVNLNNIDVRSIISNLHLRVNEFSECNSKITAYSRILRLFSTFYPYLLDNGYLTTKIIIETHSGSMKIDDAVLIREFNILIEEISNKYKYITWNLILN